MTNSKIMESFIVCVRCGANSSFLSKVCAVDGNRFLLYNREFGFGWYDFTGTLEDGQPAITLWEGESE